MSLLFRVRCFYLLHKQEKNRDHKIAWIAASQIVADRKGNAFIVEKNRKKLLRFLLLFKHFGITKH